MPADLLIVGSGAAGLMAAATAADRSSHQVALVTDRGLGTANSAVAQGGLQLPENTQQARADFVSDVVRSGGPGVDRQRLEQFVADVGPSIGQLMAWGLELDRDESGELVRGRAGGLSAPRVVTAGDRIGPAIMRVLRARVLDGVPVTTRFAVQDLTRTGDGWSVVAADGTTMVAKAVIVACGGRTRAHAEATAQESTNPANENNRLYDVLASLGLDEIDRDLYQYQPFGLLASFGSGKARCVPESVAQLGPQIVDRDGVLVVSPSQDRRTVCAAMWQAEADGRALSDASGRTGFNLTMSGLDVALVEARYPSLHRWLLSTGLAGEDLLIRPVLHYQLGGFRISPSGSTGLPGLFLAGEVAGGLHGHNRLMGNGITESIATGWRAALSACDFISQAEPSSA